MARIGILSDTHGFFDEAMVPYLRECDQIWHAGDIGDFAIVERLRELAPVVHAVSGNIDSGEVRRRCPEMEIFEVEGVRVLLTHIGGYPGRWSRGIPTMLREEGIKLMVDGHSHITKIMYDPRLEVLHINPGAAGRQGWHKVRTIVRLSIEAGNMSDCEVIEHGNKPTRTPNN